MEQLLKENGLIRMSNCVVKIWNGCAIKLGFEDLASIIGRKNATELIYLYA